MVTAAIMSSLASQAGAEAFSWYNGQWAQESSDLKPASRAHYGKLSNGFRWVIVPNTHIKGRVAMFLNVQAGSLMEEEVRTFFGPILHILPFSASLCSLLKEFRALT